MENWKVYKHTSPSNKIYIGITSRSVYERWSNGKGYSNNKYFTNAIQKYGWENFKHEILFENLSKEEACQKEIELIAEYKSNNSEFGYNITNGGESANGYHHTEKTKKIISEYSRNRIVTNETKQKIGKAKKGNTYMLGKRHSDETKQKMSKTHKGIKHTEEVKRKMSIDRKGVPRPHKGAKFTKEHRQNISKKHQNRIWVHNEIQNKWIYKIELQEYLEKGYILGMLPKRKRVDKN